MPLHCDTMDGPVVKAAKRALETENVNLILPWVPEKAEVELKKAFEETLRVRRPGDAWFCLIFASLVYIREGRRRTR